MFVWRTASISWSLIMAPLYSIQGPTTEPARQPDINDFGTPRDREPVEFDTTTRLRVLDTSRPAEGQGPLYIFNITDPARQGGIPVEAPENASEDWDAADSFRCGGRSRG